MSISRRTSTHLIRGERSHPRKSMQYCTIYTTVTSQRLAGIEVRTVLTSHWVVIPWGMAWGHLWGSEYVLNLSGGHADVYTTDICKMHWSVSWSILHTLVWLFDVSVWELILDTIHESKGGKYSHRSTLSALKIPLFSFCPFFIFTFLTPM